VPSVMAGPSLEASQTRYSPNLDIAVKMLPRGHDVNVQASDLVRINDITRDLIAHRRQQGMNLWRPLIPLSLLSRQGDLVSAYGPCEKKKISCSCEQSIPDSAVVQSVP
jgi:hypothetical protein